MGPRHPRYFGATYAECWPDTYGLLMPEMRRVLDSGQFFEVRRAPIMLTRHGFAEETFFTFTFSPLRDDTGAIAAVYQPVVEVTELVLRERRAETLRALTSQRELLAEVAAAFEANRNDLPFAKIDLYENPDTPALVVGIADPKLLSSLDPHVARALRERSVLEVPTEIVTGPWPEPIRTCLLLPLRASAASEPFGVLTVGVSPRLPLDASYRQFLDSVAQEIGTGLAIQRARAAESAWRQREEDARDRHAKRLTALFELAPVGIALFAGPNHVFEIANAKYAELLPNRQLVGRPLAEALPDMEGQGIFEFFERVYRTGEPHVGRSVALMVAQPSGPPQERYFDFVYQPLPNDEGVTDRILAVVFEVTELARAQMEGESANRAKDQFFAILGHELRNPLAPITTALELMRMGNDAAFERERSIIERQVSHIRRLVDDLLDVSRLTGGKIAIKHEAVKVEEIVRLAVEMTSPLLEARSHRLELDVAKGTAVLGDPVRLTQIVANLLSNAAKYTEKQGHIRIRATRVDAQVELTVEDSGIGISPEMLPRVFAPFEQEPQAIDRGQGGLGLGLAIASNLVKLHGGTLTAASAGIGKGSTFRLLLPATDALKTPAPAPSELLGATVKHGGMRILVVDDNEDAAELLAEVIASAGHETRTAHDGAAALRMAESFDPDVAVLDIGLPVMDGYELATRLRGSAKRKVLLVAVTGYGQASDRERALSAGFDAHLVKPIDLGSLTRLLGEYASMHDARMP